ncbi:MAG: phage terminase large subunit [Eubacteriaceae bacterium]|nr:phage terminase large subunit [Eubacteriaceae bacterium]
MEAIKPQKGPQEQFLSTKADIAIYGGAAGGGKTYALLLEPLRHIGNSEFGCVAFRKTSNQITAEGGLWDTSYLIYPQCGGEPRKTPQHSWTFPSGMKITFAHMQLEKNVLDWQGTQIPLIMFDELTHFSKSQFFYMLSRNRSSSGVKGYIRASCNPDASSWVAEFINWWWDPKTGYAIPERSGKIRWMYRLNDEIHWADTKKELWEKFDLKTVEERDEPKSVTFIASTLQDNRILMRNDPGYLANLKALPTVERERLLHGNWMIMPAAGLYFKRSRVTMIEEIPKDVVAWVRAWDLAATEDRKGQNPDDGPAYTAGVLMGKRRNGRYVVADVVNKRMNAGDVRNTVRNTAIIDKAKYRRIRIRMNQDPGQAGKEQAEQYLKLLQGYSVNIERESGDKATRFEPFSAQCLGIEGDATGNVDVIVADWNEAYFSQLESFPQSKFKDMVDASGTAFNELESMPVHTAPPPSAADADRQSPWTHQGG